MDNVQCLDLEKISGINLLVGLRQDSPVSSMEQSSEEGQGGCHRKESWGIRRVSWAKAATGERSFEIYRVEAHVEQQGYS